MLTLFIGGALLIIARYLFWDSNIPMVIGMVALLGWPLHGHQVALAAPSAPPSRPLRGPATWG